LWLFASPASLAANIVINNLDGPGEGFNDPTPTLPVGGNPGTTLGQQRLNVFQRAAEIWGGAIESAVPIVVDANLDPLECTTLSGTLGAAGAIEVYRDFPGATLSNTWYHVALANAVVGSDLSPTTSDIVATFNSDIDNNNSCLTGTNWYLGYDENPGAGISLLAVLLHEFGHGLGFSGFVDLETGRLLDNRQDVFSHATFDISRNRTWAQLNNYQRRNSATNTGNLVWNGTGANEAAGELLVTGLAAGKARLFAPNPVEPGSSVYHYDSAATPNLLMEPSLNFGQANELDLTDELLLDIGWTRLDSDGDGLSDTDEFETLNTNPFSVDTDGDGLTDGDGVVTVGNYPDGVDADGNGFVDGENQAGTDPNEADTDADGFSDGDELLAGTDPADAAPEITLLNPVSGSTFPIGASIGLSASATDPEDGDLSAAITWSSDIDGPLGTGALISTNLSTNSHAITATVVDTAGASVLATITVTVAGLPGDINDDGVVDVADLLRLQRALLGLESLSTMELQRADLHPAGGNEIADSGDLLALQGLLTSP